MYFRSFQLHLLLYLVSKNRSGTGHYTCREVVTATVNGALYNKRRVLSLNFQWLRIGNKEQEHRKEEFLISETF